MGKKRKKRIRDSKDSASARLREENRRKERIEPERVKDEARSAEEAPLSLQDWLARDPIEYSFSKERIIDTLIVLLLYAEALAMFFGASYNRSRGPTALLDNTFHRAYWAFGGLALAYIGVLFSNISYSFRALMGWLLGITGMVALTGVSLVFIHPLPRESFYRIYITSKVVVLYPVAWTLLALGLLKVLLYPAVRERVLKSPWLYVMIGYGAWELLHIFFGIMPAVSFFGSVPRQMGVITILSVLFSSFAAYTWVVEDPKNRFRWIGRFLVLVAILLAARAAFEMSLMSTRYGRPSGFAGNPDFFGNHLVLLVPVTFVLYFYERNVFWMLLSLVGFLGQEIASAYLQTRGAWLGIGVAGLVFLFTFKTSLEDREILKRLIMLLVGALLAIGISHVYIAEHIPKGAGTYKVFYKNELGLYFSAALAGGPYVLRIIWLLVARMKRGVLYFSLGLVGMLLIIFTVPALRNEVVGQVQGALRVKAIKSGHEARPFVWRDTLTLIKDHWLVGVGRENYRVAFVRHKSRRLAIIDPTVNYRSSHDMYLDMLAMEGILGFLLYLGMLGMGIHLGVRRRKYAVQHAMGIYVAGYAAHMLVVYDVVSTAYTIFMAIALAAAGAWEAPIPIEERRPRRANFLALTGVVVLFLAGIVPASYYSWIQANGDLNLARAKITSMRLRRSLSALRKYHRKEDIRDMAQKIWKSSMIAGRYCSPLGYNCYMASHALMSLTYLNPDELGDLDKNTIKKVALKFAKKGVRNNTNPESAYSRLGSAFYSVGDPANALRGFNTSIYYDHYFYDTHRMRALIYMQDYCEFDKAEKELDFAWDVLQFSGKYKKSPGKAVQGARSRLRAFKRNPSMCEARKAQRGLGEPPSEDDTFVGKPIWKE